jgi:hypothetical protein
VFRQAESGTIVPFPNMTHRSMTARADQSLGTLGAISNRSFETDRFFGQSPAIAAASETRLPQWQLPNPLFNCFLCIMSSKMFHYNHHTWNIAE